MKDALQNLLLQKISEIASKREKTHVNAAEADNPEQFFLSGTRNVLLFLF